MAPKLVLCHSDSLGRRSFPYPMNCSDFVEYFLYPESFFHVMNLTEKCRGHWLDQMTMQLAQPEPSSCDWAFAQQVLLVHVRLLSCWEGAENMLGEPAHGHGPELHCQDKKAPPRQQNSQI